MFMGVLYKINIAPAEVDFIISQLHSICSISIQNTLATALVPNLPGMNTL